MMETNKALTKRDYIMIKKYLLENEFNIDTFKREYPDIKVPNIRAGEFQNIIFVNGYLFPIEFYYNRNFFQISDRKTFKLDLEKKQFIKVTQFSEIYIDFINAIEKSAIEFSKIDEDKSLEDLEDLLDEKLHMTLLIDRKDKVSELIEGFLKALKSSELEEIHKDMKKNIENLKPFLDKFYYYAVDMENSRLGQGYIIVDSKNNFIEFIRTI